MIKFPNNNEKFKCLETLIVNITKNKKIKYEIRLSF